MEANVLSLRDLAAVRPSRRGRAEAEAAQKVSEARCGPTRVPRGAALTCPGRCQRAGAALRRCSPGGVPALPRYGVRRSSGARLAPPAPGCQSPAGVPRQRSGSCCSTGAGPPSSPGAAGRSAPCGGVSLGDSEPGLGRCPLPGPAGALRAALCSCSFADVPAPVCIPG